MSINQLSDPAFRKVLVRGIIMSGFVFSCLLGTVWFFLSETSYFSFWLVEMIVDVLGGIAVIVVTWLLFPAVASFFVALFLDDIVDAVEIRHYPNEPPRKSVVSSSAIMVSLRFTAITLVLNIIALPFYLLTIWFPPLAIVIFYILNGYLLGREYYELVALRYLSLTNSELTRKANKSQLFVAGVGITFLFTIPILNLVAPVIAVAAISHIFRSLQRVEQI